MAKRISRKPSWYIIWFFIFFTLLAVLFSVFISLPMWRIASIEVSGAEIIPPKHIVKLGEKLISENILLADYSAFKEALKDIHQIKDFGIFRKLPSRLVVKVVERKPFAVVNSPNFSAVIDDEGYILKLEGARKNAGADYSFITIRDISRLPVIKVANIGKTSPDRLGDGLSKAIGLAIGKLSRFLPASNLQLEIKSFDDISLLIDDVLRVRFGDTEGLAEKIAVLQALIPRLEGKWGNIDYVDIRISEDPVVKFKKPDST